MISRIPTYNVLAITSTSKGKELIEELLHDTGVYYHVKFISNGEAARRELINSSYNIVVINAPLIDESGEDLAIHITENTISGVIEILSSEKYVEVSDKLINYGIFTVQKPISRHIFNQALRLVIASMNKWNKYQKKNREMTIRLEQLRIISKAKCMLIEKNRLTEDQAHHYIEKLAMDERISKYDAAIKILRSC